jgi:Tol biopolymer transport system component
MADVRRLLVVSFVVGIAGFFGIGCAAPQEEMAPSTGSAVIEVIDFETGELPVERIESIAEGAEAYFSPDGKSVIASARVEGEDNLHVYTIRVDGSEARRINDQGADACAYFYPDGERLIWTSTKDHLDMDPGDFSDPERYPQGAELYVSDLMGENIQRVTDNEVYDAEVSISPSGEWILFTRQIDGQLDLWKMRVDGTDEEQITFTPDEQEGGSFFLPDSETILYRAWNVEDQGQRGMPMTIYTINLDGSDKRQITHEEGTNWAPYPAPDGKHFVFVKFLPPRNFEVFMMNMATGEQTRLTNNEAFDGFPSISPDGTTMVFSSSRGAAPGERKLNLFQMDISSFGVGP